MDKLERQLKHKIERLRRKDKTLTERKAEFLILNDMFEDMPDGAYFAAMAEHGFDADEIIELSDE